MNDVSRRSQVESRQTDGAEIVGCEGADGRNCSSVQTEQGSAAHCHIFLACY